MLPLASRYSCYLKLIFTILYVVKYADCFIFILKICPNDWTGKHLMMILTVAARIIVQLSLW
jgi:hypothetical protein